MTDQISIFDGDKPLKIDKPIRLIELFAGYGSQALSKSLLYHLAGDSIEVSCLIAIFGMMLDVDWKRKIDDLVEDICEVRLRNERLDRKQKIDIRGHRSEQSQQL